jgi:DNA-binding CsgD family transcriptional regulator
MTATVLLDTSGQLIYANAIAEEILTRGDGFGIRNGYLFAAHRGSQTTLSQAVGAAQILYNNNQTHPPAIIALRRPSGRRPYTVFVIPYPPPSKPIQWATPESQSAVMLFFSDPEAAASLFYPGILQMLYGLSPQEAYLAALLTDGRTLQEAANTLHVSLNTVKTQLKAVFAKTNIHRQTELVRLGAIHNIPACPPPKQPRGQWKTGSPRAK